MNLPFCFVQTWFKLQFLLSKTDFNWSALNTLSLERPNSNKSILQSFKSQPHNREEYSLSLRYQHRWCFLHRSWHLWGWCCEHPPRHRPQSLSVQTSCLRWKCGEPYNPLDVHRCRLSGHTLLSLHCRQSQRCRDPRSVCYHTHIIANRKLCTWLYVHSTLQIARHRVHRITKGEVKVIPYWNPCPPISHDTLPGIWRFLPNTTPCAFNIMRLIRAYSLMRRVVGRLRSFMRICFCIIYNLYIRVFW